MWDALGLARHRVAGSLYARLAVNILEDFWSDYLLNRSLDATGYSQAWTVFSMLNLGALLLTGLGRPARAGLYIAVGVLV